jgi:hypothetical protein
MSTGGTGSYLAGLVKTKAAHVKASLALGFNRPPVVPPPAPSVPAGPDPEMLDIAKKFLESL